MLAVYYVEETHLETIRVDIPNRGRGEFPIKEKRRGTYRAVARIVRLAVAYGSRLVSLAEPFPHVMGIMRHYDVTLNSEWEFE